MALFFGSDSTLNDQFLLSTSPSSFTACHHWILLFRSFGLSSSLNCCRGGRRRWKGGGVSGHNHPYTTRMKPSVDEGVHVVLRRERKRPWKVLPRDRCSRVRPTPSFPNGTVPLTLWCVSDGYVEMWVTGVRLRDEAGVVRALDVERRICCTSHFRTCPVWGVCVSCLLWTTRDSFTKKGAI